MISIKNTLYNNEMIKKDN